VLKVSVSSIERPDDELGRSRVQFSFAS